MYENYEQKLFSIPVTKTEPLESIQFIINDFIKKKISFVVDGKGTKWEIWRHEFENDPDNIKKKKGIPSNPKLVYIEGEEVYNAITPKDLEEE